MKKIILIILLFAFCVNITCAQRKMVMVAARGTFHSPGASVTIFTDKKAAVHGIYSYSANKEKHLFSCLYTEHTSIKKLKGMSWFWGAGLHIGYTRHIEISDPKPGFETQVIKEIKKTVGGTNVIFGMNYKMKHLPVFMGIDLKPYVNFINREAELWDGAATVGMYF